MHLLVGLGNPGKAYANTRHNVGFLALEHIRRIWHFPEFTKHKRANALVARGTRADRAVLLTQPQTFMNASGNAVGALARYAKVPTKNIWVIYDDAALPFGHLPVAQNKTSGGHNGIASILAHIPDASFLRFRIGIAPMHAQQISLDQYVLNPCTASETKLLRASFTETAAALDLAFTDTLDRVKERFH